MDVLFGFPEPAWHKALDRRLAHAQAADEKHKLFADERSDFMGWLKLWRWYEEQVQHKKTNRQLQTLLQDHFLSPRRMREWRDIHGQLHAQLVQLGLRILLCTLELALHHLNDKPAPTRLGARVDRVLLANVLVVAICAPGGGGHATNLPVVDL